MTRGLVITLLWPGIWSDMPSMSESSWVDGAGHHNEVGVFVFLGPKYHRLNIMEILS